MAQERLAYPKSMLQSMEPILRRQETYDGGMNSDDPPSEIGPSEASDLFNLIAFPKYCIDRPGVSAQTPARTLPHIGDFSTQYDSAPSGEKTWIFFKAKKVGYTVFLYPKDSGIPTQSPAFLLEGNYLIWPDGTSDEIHAMAFDSTEGAFFFTSSFSGDIAQTNSAVQRWRCWGIHTNKQTGNIIVQLGTYLFYTTNTWANYKKISPIGRVGNTEQVANSYSEFRSDKDQVYVFNENGIFRVVFDVDSAYYYQINADQPTVRLFEDLGLSTKIYGRNRIYTLSRIVANDSTGKPLYGSRNTEGLVIQQESAPVLPDSNHLDASMGFQDIPIGMGASIYEEITSDGSVMINAQEWAGLASPGAFKITLDGADPHTIITDFSNVTDMPGVCALIQVQLRVFWPKAECFFRSFGSSGQIVITGGRDDGNTVSHISAPTGVGTYIDLGIGGVDYLRMESGQINQMHSDRPQVVYGLAPTSDRWTHYSIYESLDTGVNGVAKGNLPDLLVWSRDIPVIKVFRALLDIYGHITVYDDPALDPHPKRYFTQDDVGSFIVWADPAGRITDRITFVPTQELSSTAVSERYAIFAPYTSPTIMSMGAKKMTMAWQNSTGFHLDPSKTDPWQQFEQADAGKILFLEDGSIRHILSVDGEYQCQVHENGSGYWFGDHYYGNSNLAVAWDPIEIIDSGIENTKLFRVNVEPASGPSVAGTYVDGMVPVSADIGKLALFFIDGEIGVNSISYLLAVSGDTLSFDSGFGAFTKSLKNVTVLLTDYIPPRFFNDFITDETLASRGDDPAYVLQERFFRPLPNSSIGDLGQGFMFVAERGTNIISYSEMPTYRKYIAGFYHPSWQADTGIEDVVTYLKKYPDRMVAFGRKSTWGTNLNQINSVKQTEIGEEIFTVPAFSLVDNIGLMHVGSIQDIGIGQTIIVTADGRTLFFNGRQYGTQDFSGDKISKAIRSLHTVLMSSYDPWGGYLLYGSANVSSDLRNFVNADEGFCLRFACFTSQGCGWSRFGGLNMVFPMPNTGGIEIYTATNMAIQVMLDERTGKWYQINTYDGPAGSGLVESHFDKKAHPADSIGADIVCHISGAEYHGTRESETLEHMVSHVYIRPRTLNNQYLANFSVNSQIYKDGSILYSAKTLNNPITGDIAYDRKIQGKRIQSVFEFMAGGFYITANDIMFVQRDTAGSTAISARSTSEMDQQREYAQGNIWITRGSKPLLNRQTGFSATGTFTPITGPDGLSNSAMQFNGGDGIALDNGGTLAGDMTVQFGFKFNI